ncbi:MAG: LysR family transcriptional regulator [Clostridia bacterium]|nr:LysR family transcriptional regulator [Clostridia bacterium]
MDTARYRAFLSAVETGSFTKAAEALRYTPSGVCQLVNALEKELGLTLLVRDKRGVTLTHNGAEVLPAVRALLLEEERLHQLAAGLNGLTLGRITIGAYSSVSTHWLPAIIKGFQEIYPNVEIHLMEGIHQEIDAWLAEKKIDMAFYSFKTPMKHKWIPLAEDPMIAVLPMDHPLAGEKAYPLSYCQRERFIMPGLGMDADVEALFRANHLSPRIGFSTLETFSTLAMIEQGLGMTITNALITKKWEGNVARLPLDPPQSITLGIALQSLKKASPAVRRFVDYAVERLRRPEATAKEATV